MKPGGQGLKRPELERMVAAAVIGSLLLLTSTAPSWAADRRTEGWKRRVEEAERQLRGGEYEAPQKTTIEVAQEMVDALGPGDAAEHVFAIVLLLRAVSEAGLGNLEDSIWYWWIAQQLHPPFMEQNLSAFGEPGRVLMEHQLPDQGGGDGPIPVREIPEARWVDERELTPPEEKRKEWPVFPPGASMFQVEGMLVVQTILDDDGRLYYPIILEAPAAPTMVYTALEAMKKWEFEPARLHGKPVPVFYNLTVRFDAEGPALFRPPPEDPVE